MVSVRKRNIQGRYNSARHLQRRYLELPSLRVVKSSVPISLENQKKQNKTQLIHLKVSSSPTPPQLQKRKTEAATG